MCHDTPRQSPCFYFVVVSSFDFHAAFLHVDRHPIRPPSNHECSNRVGTSQHTQNRRQTIFLAFRLIPRPVYFSTGRVRIIFIIR